MVQVVVMGLTALGIAFYYSWKLTLLIVGFVPLLAFAGGVHIKIFTGFALAEGKKLIDASETAAQAIMNVRTVASLGKEEHFIKTFNDHLMAPYRFVQVFCYILYVIYCYNLYFLCCYP